MMHFKSIYLMAPIALGMLLCMMVTATVNAEDNTTVITIKPDTKLTRNVTLSEHAMGLELTNEKGDGLVVTPLDEPISSGKATFSLSYQSTRKENGARNGYLLLGTSKGIGYTIAVGTLIGGRAHNINVRDKKLNKSLKTKMSNNTKFDAVIAVDLDAKTVTLTIGDQTLETKLPEKFKSIQSVGYQASSTSTAFSPITITR